VHDRRRLFHRLTGGVLQDIVLLLDDARRTNLRIFPLEVVVGVDALGASLKGLIFFDPRLLGREDAHHLRRGLLRGHRRNDSLNFGRIGDALLRQMRQQDFVRPRIRVFLRWL
jgi:hypothetical protein